MRLTTSFLALSLALATAAAACSTGVTSATPDGSQAGNGSAGESGNPDTEPVAKKLRLTPADSFIGPVAGFINKVDYRAFYSENDGPESDVSSEVEWSYAGDADGEFDGSTFFVMDTATGVDVIKATSKELGVTATTTLTVAPRTIVIGPGAPPNAPSQFDGPFDPNASPQLVYPPDGILTPPNMNSLEIHFIPAPGQGLFEITFIAPTVSLSAYVMCKPLGVGCVYEPDPTFWAQLADAARGTEPVRYSIRGVDLNGTTGISSQQRIQFATEDLVGGLYYWNDSGVVMRYDFGYPGKKAEVFINQFDAGAFTCVGCHEVSRDGTRMAVGNDMPAPAAYKVFDVATKKVIYGGGAEGSNFFSFSPDASLILTSNGISISMRDANTGAMIGQNIVPLGTMPNWAPDGLKMVYARPLSAPPFGLPIPGVDSAALEVMDGDGKVQQLVPFTGENNYYPSYSPDQNWVVFNRSPSNRNSFDNGSADSSPDGQVWAVPANGGQPFKLARAASPNGGDQWPKWSPTIMSYAGGDVMWMTFSSYRGYGLRPSGSKAQIWMTAFDGNRATLGEDPSFPAFWMPFQDYGSGNHIAQWVTEIVRKPCKEKTDCEGNNVCQAGKCVPIIN